VRLHDTRELASGDLFHTVTSSTRSVVPGFNSPCSARSQPSIASRTFTRSSSTVSPCETQPGKAGTSAQNPPSSALWINTFSVTPLEYLSTTRAASSGKFEFVAVLTDHMSLITDHVPYVSSVFPIRRWMLDVERWTLS